jgi:hypothetical protein
MKFIRETFEDIQVLTELDEATGEKSFFIEGIFMQSDVKNRNGRVYPRETLQMETKRYIKEHVEKNRAYGELGHPDGPIINLDRTSHMIKSIKEDGNNFIGKAKILDTPNGNIVKALMKEGASLGVSSRGVGSLRPIKGVQEVQKDFRLATPADIVADPSAPDAFVNGIMEGKEWIFIDGRYMEQDIDQAVQVIESVSREDREAAKITVFENFLSKL